jgi:hypothetical protein
MSWFNFATVIVGAKYIRNIHIPDKYRAKGVPAGNTQSVTNALPWKIDGHGEKAGARGRLISSHLGSVGLAVNRHLVAAEAYGDV